MTFSVREGWSFPNHQNNSRISRVIINVDPKYNPFPPTTTSKIRPPFKNKRSSGRKEMVIGRKREREGVKWEKSGRLWAFMHPPPHVPKEELALQTCRLTCGSGRGSVGIPAGWDFSYKTCRLFPCSSVFIHRQIGTCLLFRLHKHHARPHTIIFCFPLYGLYVMPYSSTLRKKK